jgi:AcrR family transcriptional regulator
MNRPYDSPLRAEQQELTRQRILEAVVDELGERSPDELSFASIAARSKVSERTVYRHYPTKEALMEAFWTWWIAGPFGIRVEQPMEAADFPAYVAEVYRAFDRHERVSRALIVSPVGREIRDRSRHRRLKMIEATFEDVLRRFAPSERKLALAVFQMLFSITTWQTLRDFRKLSGSEAGKAAGWAARVLLAELRKNPKTFEDTP